MLKKHESCKSKIINNIVGQCKKKNFCYKHKIKKKVIRILFVIYYIIHYKLFLKANQINICWAFYRKF